jgi:large subunit ribosomal protein L24
MNRIRKGDDVVVIAGKYKGQRGRILRVLDGDRVIVEGINLMKKHQRPNPAQGVQGGIIDKEAPLHASNVMPWNPQTKKGDRIGRKRLEDGRKVRFFKSNGEVVDV